MVSIRLPIPYTVFLSVERNGKVNKSQTQGVDIGDFEIPEYEPDDVKVIASWEQAWGSENAIGREPLFEAAPEEWKKTFQSRPALNRLIMIDGEFYSPLKLAPRDGVSTYLVTDANFQSAIILSSKIYETLACTGAVSTYFDQSSPYQRNLKSSNYLANEGKVINPSHKGKRRDGDTLEHVREAMKAILSNMAVIDGMIWTQIAEPVLRLSISGEEAALSVSHEPVGHIDTAMFFSIADFDIAVETLAANFTHDKIRINIADIQIDHPEVLRPSMEYDEAVRGVRRFFALTRASVAQYTKEAGKLWFGLKEILGDGIVSEDLTLSEGDMDKAVAMVEKMAALLPSEGIKDVHDRERARAVALAKLTVDRWRMRPVDAAPTKGMSL